MKINITKEILLQRREDSIAPLIRLYYNTSKEDTMVGVFSEISKSDTIDRCKLKLLKDGSWEHLYDYCTKKNLPQGTMRDYLGLQIISKDKNGEEKLVMFSIKGIIPDDDVVARLWNWTLWYSVSSDGGKTIDYEKQVIQRGEDENGRKYDAMYSMRGVETGASCVMIGDQCETPIITQYQKDESRNGEILVGVQKAIIGEDGKYYNPGLSFSYLCSAVLHGKWKNDGYIDWDLSDDVNVSPEESTRGMCEPAVAEMRDGSIIMIMRGSNHNQNKKEPPTMPSYRWIAVSKDGGYSWSRAVPWTYDSGKKFFSPASCSQILKHSNGKYYWIGNICDHNPNGNMPRYPLVIGEIEENSYLLKEDTVVTIATREKGQSENVTYSNFFAHEERGTQDILVYITPWHVIEKAPFSKTDAYVYRIRILE